ncbi:type II toxin-antitoxin system RelE/ParE family toxin [Methylopila sp. M107]|uniref:type II toxin-antitoxin system RelE/ParE family toxin n=1 Tax=Methylopila sp. M107 TaxID=1101190 RepID=UPI00036E03A3|nr:type II toxin-antitoxin system RelE/ParE family toxin [Methylopila sp. M107]
MAFRLLPAAEADLQAIVRHIAADDPAAALRWFESILARCRRLGDMPEMGVARPDVRPDLRLLPVGNYLILYREADGDAEIVRVVHGARQWRDLV